MSQKFQKNLQTILLPSPKEGKSVGHISGIMGKGRLCVKGKLFSSGLNSVVVATVVGAELQQQQQQQQPTGAW